MPKLRNRELKQEGVPVLLGTRRQFRGLCAVSV
ncbi:hypothetical protein E2C01_072558 [Portunus trituberculatus]|uniref:Uncharacterized protein n=1 Tax=Portunus trituberculatus TaxID=210409 RepID=A0A5B7I714_PORTR|nr:hypothetical protein [Portunus trituberculatus]